MPSFDVALQDYQTALEHLQSDTGNCVIPRQVIQILQARDRLEAALNDPNQLPTADQLLKLMELDQQLKQQVATLVTIVSFADLRASVAIAKQAWWWNLETLAPPHPHDRHDWFWKLLTFSTWTVNLAFLGNIISRFLSADPGVLGAIAIVLPSLLTLLQAKNELTSNGAEGFRKFLAWLRVPAWLREEAQFVSTLILLIGLVGFWFWLLPALSDWYNKRGLAAYADGRLSQAASDYQRAIALNAENTKARFNLGNVYEDWQEFDSARKEYLLAVQGKEPEAYNNLARLYILDKKYPQAVTLLRAGIKLEPPFDEVKYSLFKNLGWVRFEQQRYEEAQHALQVAIGFANRSESKSYISSPASAHCLLAQVLERQRQPGTTQHWRQCSQLQVANPEEDGWVHLAEKKLKLAAKLTRKR